MTIEIVDDYRPGAIGAITALHARYYSTHWGFGLYFEAKVATALSEFLQRIDPATDGIWLALSGEAVVGSIVIDGGEPEAPALGAHLRLFILDDRFQGKGLGRDLMQRAVDFCDAKGYRRSYLSTFEGLDSARALYERFGYRLVEEQPDTTWGVEVKEQLFERLRP
jgi:GNAT superfamily N-acetyltransferase